MRRIRRTLEEDKEEEEEEEEEKEEHNITEGRSYRNKRTRS